MLRTCSVVVVLMLASLTAAHLVASEQNVPAAPGPVSVTIKYAGKGTVDASHRIWVWLFTSPDINAGSIPIAEASIDKNGGTATFTGVSSSPVYIAIAYDEQGGFLGNAPPPSGSPVTFYGVKSATDAPQPVTPGPKGTITVTFNDAQRMP